MVGDQRPSWTTCAIVSSSRVVLLLQLGDSLTMIVRQRKHEATSRVTTASYRRGCSSNRLILMCVCHGLNAETTHTPSEQHDQLTHYSKQMAEARIREGSQTRRTVPAKLPSTRTIHRSSTVHSGRPSIPSSQQQAPIFWRDIDAIYKDIANVLVFIQVTP
jgi:hypothetical protein